MMFKCNAIGISSNYFAEKLRKPYNISVNKHCPIVLSAMQFDVSIFQKKIPPSSLKIIVYLVLKNPIPNPKIRK